MDRRRSPTTPSARLRVALAVACALALTAGAAWPQGEAERRAQTGVRLFRSLLAADLALDSKVGPDGELVLVVFHAGDRRRAEALAAALRGPGTAPEKLRGLPVRVEISADRALAAYQASPPAGIFLAQPLDGAVRQGLVDYGIRRHVIVYSPFEGDVEKGVHAGLAVEAQVRPYVNTETLAASQIALKPFFMKVTKVYPAS
jgi:hypothetical protein